jgi:hypothetical protein
MEFQIQRLTRNLLGFIMGMAMVMGSMVMGSMEVIWGLPMVFPAKDLLGNSSRQTST